MELLADECIWRDVVDALREAGFGVSWIHDIAPGADDRDVLSLSVQRRLLLITEDGDFGDLVFREHLKAYGIVRVRLSQFEGTREQVADAVPARLVLFADRLVGRFTTLEADRTRQRLLPVRSVQG